MGRDGAGNWMGHRGRLGDGNFQDGPVVRGGSAPERHLPKKASRVRPEDVGTALHSTVEKGHVVRAFSGPACGQLLLQCSPRVPRRTLRWAGRGVEDARGHTWVCRNPAPSPLPSVCLWVSGTDSLSRGGQPQLYHTDLELEAERRSSDSHQVN